MKKLIRIYQMAQRKCWHHDPLPEGWQEIAWERFNYVECAVFEKAENELTEEDLNLIRCFGEIPDEWIPPNATKVNPYEKEEER